MAQGALDFADRPTPSKRSPLCVDCKIRKRHRESTLCDPCLRREVRKEKRKGVTDWATRERDRLRLEDAERAARRRGRA